MAAESGPEKGPVLCGLFLPIGKDGKRKKARKYGTAIEKTEGMDYGRTQRTI